MSPVPLEPDCPMLREASEHCRSVSQLARTPPTRQRGFAVPSRARAAGEGAASASSRGQGAGRAARCAAARVPPQQPPRHDCCCGCLLLCTMLTMYATMPSTTHARMMLMQKLRLERICARHVPGWAGVCTGQTGGGAGARHAAACSGCPFAARLQRQPMELRVVALELCRRAVQLRVSVLDDGVLPVQLLLRAGGRGSAHASPRCARRVRPTRGAAWARGRGGAAWRMSAPALARDPPACRAPCRRACPRRARCARAARPGASWRPPTPPRSAPSPRCPCSEAGPPARRWGQRPTAWRRRPARRRPGTRRSARGAGARRARSCWAAGTGGGGGALQATAAGSLRAPAATAPRARTRPGRRLPPTPSGTAWIRSTSAATRFMRSSTTTLVTPLPCLSLRCSPATPSATSCCFALRTSALRAAATARLGSATASAAI